MVVARIEIVAVVASSFKMIGCMQLLFWWIVFVWAAGDLFSKNVGSLKNHTSKTQSTCCAAAPLLLSWR